MSELLEYGVGSYVEFPLIGDGVQDFVTDYVPAAGDAKLFTDTQISTNLTSFILGFDSLSEIPAQGATIEENGAGTAEGVVEVTVIISGTVGGGDAAGFFFMRSVTGQAWSNNDQIDINGGTANIATADSTTYDLAATAGLIADLGEGQFAAAFSPTEATFAQGTLRIRDTATKAIEDQTVILLTAGNANAYFAYDPFDSVRLGLTALPNAAADAAGGLPISDAGGLDLDDIPVTAEFEARTLVSASYFDPAADAVANVTLVATTTTNTDVRGTDNALLASTFSTMFAGMTAIAEWLGAIAGKQTGDATARTEIRATGAGSGTYDETTDSQEAIRDTAPLGTAMRGTDNAVLASVFTGITLMSEWLGLIAGKQVADATAKTEIQATGAGSGTYDEATDSQEAIRDTAPLGTAMRGTDSALLASSAPTNFSSLLIDGGGLISLAATGLDAIVSTAVGMVEIAKAIWDRALTGATHNLSTSAGRRLRQLGSQVQTDGTITDGAPTATDFDTDVSMVDNFYDHSLLVITSGALIGQGRPIDLFSSTNGNFFFDEGFTAAPANGDTFVVVVGHIHSLGAIGGAVWDEATAGHVAAGSFGLEVSTHATPAEVLTQVLAALDTAIGVSPTADSINERVKAIDLLTEANGAGDLAAILVGTDTTIPALIAALNDIAASDVLAQALAALDTAIGGSPTADSVNERLKALDEDWEDGGRLDVLVDRLITEIDTATGEPGQGAPGVSLTRGAKLDFLYKWARNRSNQTATLWQGFADDATTVDQKRTISDDATTFEAGEVETGP